MRSEMARTFWQWMEGCSPSERFAIIEALVGRDIGGRPMTYEDGATLGCPTCAAREQHVCLFQVADGMRTRMRSRTLAHLRAIAEREAEPDSDSAEWVDICDGTGSVILCLGFG